MSGAPTWLLLLWVGAHWVQLGNPVESRARCLELGQQVLPLMQQRRAFIATRYMCKKEDL